MVELIEFTVADETCDVDGGRDDNVDSGGDEFEKSKKRRRASSQISKCLIWFKVERSS